jgi:hypothetical protein
MAFPKRHQEIKKKSRRSSSALKSLDRIQLRDKGAVVMVQMFNDDLRIGLLYISPWQAAPWPARPFSREKSVQIDG